MSCIKCEDLSSPETHPLNDFFRSLHCSYCNKKRFEKLGFIFKWGLLVFLIPILLNSIIKWNPVIAKETKEVEAMTLGVWIVPILWWTLLGIFFSYREKIRDLKQELLKMKAISCKLTREEIEDASKKDLLEGLKYFLENTRAEEKSSAKALNYNIKSINLLLTSFDSDDFNESYRQFREYTK